MSKHFFIFIFIFSFIVAGFFQWTRWKELDDFIDGSMWSHQAEYVQTGNPSEFDAKAAYGHPGGPLIEGTIAFHQAFNISYDYSLIIFISIFNALIIAVSCALCFILRKNNLWWLAVLSALSFNIMYNVSTPPTALVSPLIVLLCLLTLYFYENKEKIKTPQTLFFAFILGLAVATRADIAGFYALAFLIFLLYEKAINWKKFLIIASGSFVFFALFDPFMYFMPWQHIKDLFAKIIFHYGEINPSHMTLENIAAISSFGFCCNLPFSRSFIYEEKDKIVFAGRLYKNASFNYHGYLLYFFNRAFSGAALFSADNFYLGSVFAFVSF